MKTVKVIGGGLAGTEAALYLAKKGIKVTLFDIKPKSFTPAHKNPDYAELVCSNSLKSNDVFGNAAGLLKEELRILGSEVIAAADKTRVPAGNALAVNREEFSRILTKKIKSENNIECVSEEVKDINFDEYTIIATGPLTTGALSEKIFSITGGKLSFYDASAPIVTAESIDFNSAFIGDRYDKGNGDHVNCPLNKEEYVEFITELLNGEVTILHDFEKREIFEGCMPIEIMARRGIDTLRFGPLKPAGLADPKTGRWPYACLQLRKEDEEGKLYNLVGFQTNLKWGEQKRIFGIIPALKNAEYVRYGVMHRNSFINSPTSLNKDFSLKNNEKIFFAGQITGVEGYVESVMAGLIAAINCERKINGKEKINVPETTVTGSLIKYITTENCDFQPMNANFGILPTSVFTKDKAEKKRLLAEKSIKDITEYKERIEL